MDISTPNLDWVSDENVKEMCAKMTINQLNKLLLTSKRYYNLCRGFLDQRKEEFKKLIDERIKSIKYTKDHPEYTKGMVYSKNYPEGSYARVSLFFEKGLLKGIRQENFGYYPIPLIEPLANGSPKRDSPWEQDNYIAFDMRLPNSTKGETYKILYDLEKEGFRYQPDSRVVSYIK